MSNAMFTQKELYELWQRTVALSKETGLSALLSAELADMARTIDAVYNLLFNGTSTPKPVEVTTTKCEPLTTSPVWQDSPTLVTVYVRSVRHWEDGASLIKTPQGDRVIKPGDVLITSMDGQQYICPAHKFSPDFDMGTGRSVIILDVGEHAHFPSGKMGGKF